MTKLKHTNSHSQQRLQSKMRAVLRVRRFASKVNPRDKESFVFPNEFEGQNYSVNWSLCEDGITSTGLAFHNARSALLAIKTGIPKQAANFSINSPALLGKYKLQEAGDQITHEAFNALRENQHSLFSNGSDMFVEDGSLGTLESVRVGVRVVSNNPASSLIFRNLLIPKAPKEIDHRARFNSWNLDPRWEKTVPVWDGKAYKSQQLSATPLKGQRPILASWGHIGDTLAVQFVEADSKVVGATIVAGEKVPARGLVEAIGLVSDALMNEDLSLPGISIPSTVLTIKDRVVVVIGGSGEELVAASAKKNALYGAYNNYILANGVAASWNGYIAPTLQSGLTSFPTVVNKDDSVIANPPDNFVPGTVEFVFIESGASKTGGSLSEEDAITRLTALTNPSRVAALKDIVKGKKVTVFGSTSDVVTALL